MKCSAFENLLFEGLDAVLAPADEQRMREHENGCARCRELAALMRGDAEPDAALVPDDLTAGIMARTSGDPCDRAQLLLAQSAQPLAEDGGLLALHLGGCRECATMARALVQLRTELPGMAELDPGAGFVAGVMAATVGVARPVPASRWTRVGEVWERLAQRPRLALEGAYAAALVVLLVFGLPSASLAEIPARALEGVRQGGARVERVVSGGVEELADLGRVTWDGSTERAAALLGRAEGSAAGAEFADTARAWADAARRMVTGVWDTLFAPVVNDLMEMWNGNRSDDSTTSTER